MTAELMALLFVSAWFVSMGLAFLYGTAFGEQHAYREMKRIIEKCERLLLARPGTD